VYELKDRCDQLDCNGVCKDSANPFYDSVRRFVVDIKKSEEYKLLPDFSYDDDIFVEKCEYLNCYKLTNATKGEEVVLRVYDYDLVSNEFK